MKILVVCSTLDLQYKLGCTPSWWQFLKALHETGHEVIALPFLGDPVESLWWRCYPNPCSAESRLMNRYLGWKKSAVLQKKSRNPGQSRAGSISERYIRGKWERHLVSVPGKERDTDILLFMNVPLNFIRGIPERIKSAFGIPVAYYDGDMPTILPEYAAERGFKFNYYVGADLSGFDRFFTNSQGSIPALKEMGARDLRTLSYAADPELFRPVPVARDIDVSFFGYGSGFREEWMKKMIADPSDRLPGRKFSVAGTGFAIPLGRAEMAGDLSFSAYRTFTCRSKICLNITRWSHACVYGSATARPFELAAFGACIVSQPYSGIEEWFSVGREIVVVQDEQEIIPTYESLLDSDEEREKIGERARERVLKSHTYRHRANEFIQALQ